MAKLSNCVLFFIAVSILPLSIIYLPGGSILLDIEPKGFDVPLPESLDQYKQNIRLKSFEEHAKINGPESIAYYQGRMVTGSNDGYLYEVKDDKTTKKLIKLVSDQMMKQTNNTRIIRPLGVRFDSKGNLWAVEPEFGIFMIQNIFSANPKVNLMFNIDQTAELGPPSMFLDDAAIEEKPNGGFVLYISDVSSRFSSEEYRLSIFASERGKILRYDTDSKKLDILVDNLLLPNGVEMMANNSGIIFVECIGRAIWKYSFVGPNKNKPIKLIAEMPAETDNIRVSANGQTYWLAMLKPRTSNNPISFDRLRKFPMVAKLLCRTFYLIGKIFEFIHMIIPVDLIKWLAENFKTLHILEHLDLSLKTGGMFLEIDENGKILTSVYNTDKTDFAGMTEVREIPSRNPSERVLFLGSVSLPMIRKVILAE